MDSPLEPQFSLDMSEPIETIQLDLVNDKPKSEPDYPKSTPERTKTLRSVSMTYSDGTSETFEILEDQGFHRTNSMRLGQKWLIEHEVYFTYGA